MPETPKFLTILIYLYVLRSASPTKLPSRHQWPLKHNSNYVDFTIFVPKTSINETFTPNFKCKRYVLTLCRHNSYKAEMFHVYFSPFQFHYFQDFSLRKCCALCGFALIPCLSGFKAYKPNRSMDY